MVQARHPFENLYTVSLVAAPLVLGLSTVLYALGGGINQDVAGGAVQVMAFPFFMLAFFALAQPLARAMPRAANLLLLTGLAGCAAGVGFGIESMYIAQGHDPVQQLQPWGYMALMVPGLLFPITMGAIGVLSVVTRTLPMWSGIAVAVAAISFPAGRMFDVAWIALATDFLFLMALTSVAWTRSQAPKHAAYATPA